MVEDNILKEPSESEQAKRLNFHRAITQAYVQPKHRKIRLIRNSAGYLLFLLLVLTAVPNVFLFESTKADMFAKEQLHNIKQAVYKGLNYNSDFEAIQLYGIKGPRKLEVKQYNLTDSRRN